MAEQNSQPRKNRAPRNRTLELSVEEESFYARQLRTVDTPVALPDILDTTLNQDCLSAVPHLPAASIDLLLLDPPYNLAKSFNGRKFGRKDVDQYTAWIESWFAPLMRLLAPTATVYACGDWLTSLSMHAVLSRYLVIRNRITWEREKGRGALRNWKNCSEDIWFATVGEDYHFDVEAVKLRRRVIAPYREKGVPKDWDETQGGNYRLTSPSNLWTDVTVPFWSMPENTDHPTQKPEKLIAKLILASSREGDVVLDPFLGSGTTSVVARKLNRRYIGIEVDRHYCCLAEKRLSQALEDRSIQGYSENVFWERNTLKEQRRSTIT